MTIELLLYGYFGLALNYAFQLYKHYPRISKNGGFSLWFYFRDNLPRMLLGLLVVPAAIKFPDFFTGVKIEATEVSCFGLGLFVDTAIDAIKNRKK